MPRFRGGSADSVYAYLNRHRQYPAEAAAQRLEGRVFVSFVVSPAGTTEQVKIVKSSNPLFEAEALRLIQTMPAWEPGRQAGRAVPVAQTLQINFRLPPVQPLLSGPRPAAELYPPRPVGGQEALAAHLKSATYPEAARQTQTSALVFVSVQVDSLGQVSGVRPLSLMGDKATRNPKAGVQAPDATLVEAAVAALGSSGLRWQAAVRNGQPSSSAALVPVLFDGATGTVGLLPGLRLFPTEPPVIEGGGKALYEFLGRNIKYPPAALRAGLQGKVTVLFEVSEEGRVQNPLVVGAAHPELDAEAVRVVSQLPPLFPALEQGQPVRSFYLVPITFTVVRSGRPGPAPAGPRMRTF